SSLLVVERGESIHCVGAYRAAPAPLTRSPRPSTASRGTVAPASTMTSSPRIASRTTALAPTSHPGHSIADPTVAFSPTRHPSYSTLYGSSVTPRARLTPGPMYVGP